jgi:hypothetical protein
MYYSKYIAAHEEVKDIAPTNKAVVAGGTQGIGAAIALRFALAGASVWIIGRSEGRGLEVVEKLKQASLEGARRKNQQSEGVSADHAFLKADLSDVEEIKRVAEEVKKRAGKDGIDWLFETQGEFEFSFHLLVRRYLRLALHCYRWTSHWKCSRHCQGNRFALCRSMFVEIWSSKVIARIGNHQASCLHSGFTWRRK